MIVLKSLEYQTKTLPNGCHVVTSHKATIDGRPAIKWEGKKIPMYRYVYAKAHGTSVTALEGKEILHSCDNPQCVNPKHLSRGSHKANMKDMAKKGRSRNGATGPLKLTLNKSYKLHYKTKFQGMPISIENDKGSYRSWKDDQGNEGLTFMAFPYGYINLTEGTDGDHVDVYIGPHRECRRVFVIHQNRPDTGEFDEDKCMIGFRSPEDAKGAYLAQYDDPRFFGEMEEYDIDVFKQLLKDRKGMKIKNDSIMKSQQEVINMKTGKRAPLYKVQVMTASEIMEKAKYKKRKKGKGGKWVYEYADKKGRKRGQSKDEATKPESKIDRTTQHIKNFDADWQVTTRMDMQGEADLANEKLDKEIVRLEGEIDKFPDNPANGQLKEKIKQLTIQATDNNKKANAKIQNPSEFMTDSQLTNFMKNWKSPALRAAAANVGSRIITEKIDNMSDSELRRYAGPEASIPKDQKAYARALEAERAGGASRPVSKSRKLVFYPESLEKARPDVVGTVRTHKDGKKYKKGEDGKWHPVEGEGKPVDDVKKEHKEGTVREHNGKKYGKGADGKWHELKD